MAARALLALGLALAAAAGAAARPPELEAAADWPLVFCTSPIEPMVYCTPGSNSTVAPGSNATFSGFEYEAVVIAARGAGLERGTDYVVRCLAPEEAASAALAALSPQCSNCTAAPVGGPGCAASCAPVAPGERCDLLFGEVKLTTQRVAAGLTFSYPMYRGAVKILTAGSVSGSDGWSWTQPFSLSLWIAVGATLVLFPLAVLLVELLSLRRSASPHALAMGWQEVAWRGVWAFAHGETMEVGTLAARVAVVAFAFTALIISSTYTANLAAVLTVSTVGADGSVQGAADLRGRAVATAPVYMDRLREDYGVLALDASGGTSGLVTDFTQLVAQVQTGQLAALVWDEQVLTYLADKSAGCAVVVLADELLPFDVAWVWRSGTAPELVGAIDAQIQSLLEDSQYTQLEAKYLATGSECVAGGSADVGNEAPAVSFQDVYGLWVVLAGALGLGILICLVGRRKLRRAWIKAAAAKLAGGAGAGAAAAAGSAAAAAAAAAENGDAGEMGFHFRELESCVPGMSRQLTLHSDGKLIIQDGDA